MVIPGEATSNRYVASSDGAPPVPPPGGYRGAQRSRAPQLPPGAPVPPRGSTADKPKRTWMGIAALIVAAVYVIVLVIVLNVGGSHTLYGFNMLALQIAVLVFVLVALFTPGARGWGSAALALCLVANVATVGAAGALTSAYTGNYENLKSDDQKFWEKYPGIKDEEPVYLIGGPSYEEYKADADELLGQVRNRLTTDFGFSWTEPADEMKRPIRNGYGGESWFFTYTSEKWMTNEAVHGVSDKTAVMNSINSVVNDFGYDDMYSLTEPGYRDDKVLEQLYGSAEPTEQAIWEFYADDYDANFTLYVQIVDLSMDTEDGRFRKDREDWNARSGEPLEGVILYVVTGPTISEDDEDAFDKLLAEYE
ncbi:hypothetical protein GCM10009860_00670 [Microbacterium mitrae]|uniref:Uncharacterized protein n=1 Tax=Microbacterium mitrae TaxID=664640 RepID=A0A5C8HR38_9MICO|nr:hypothetical protein [Microbacterium mitrae]TXK05493.1 hypothetical protein FVP60_00370 [Microbacterium mitrae]